MAIYIVIILMVFLIKLKIRRINELWKMKESKMTQTDWFKEYATLYFMGLLIPVMIIVYLVFFQ